MAGAATHAASRGAKQRSTVPVDYWHKQRSPLEFGREEFRVTALRGGGRRSLHIDDIVEAFDWQEDAKHLMSGSVTLRRPDGSKFDLRPGDMVKVEASPWGQAHWRELWRMRITEPEFQIAASQFVYQLADDLVRLNQSKGDFRYHKDKAHPHGWRGDEIIRDLGKRYGFKVGALPRFRHRIKKYNATGVSPLHVIAQVLKFERTETGRRFFLGWKNGKLWVTPFQRSRELLAMGPTIIDGTYQQTIADNFATVLDITAAATKKHGKDSKGHTKHTKHRVKVRVTTPQGVKRYGYIVGKRTGPKGAQSVAELRAYGKRLLGKIAQPKQELTFTHEGIPSLKRGHAIRLSIPEADIKRRVVFVSDVHHSVQQGAYTMEVTVSFEDPYVNQRPKKVLAKRCEAARKRHRPKPRGCTGHEHKKPQPKNSKRRATGPRGSVTSPRV